MFFMKKDKGLGDTIERITNTTGISKLFNSISNDCGCKKRQKMLNQLFPYKKKFDNVSTEHMTVLEWLEFNIKQDL